MYKILLPESGEKAYQVAAEAFQEMYEKVTGEKLAIICTADTESDLIVIGSDAVNDFTAQAFAEDWIDSFEIRYGTDDYAIRSVEKNGHTYLFLAGGRGRSTLYAVYDYFERVAGCHYYWDGDVIPHHDSLPLGGLCVTEQPRFEYRGLRYFAHRGLHRFQAEHWSLDDWKQEIDWMVKRRLNYFMLRIGMDDIWQRAFPDIVPYPNATKELPEALDGFDDRTLFWPLEYRGMLRKKLLEYAFERDLMHSEDCGTMTHWYSRTPYAYLEAKKPKPLVQTHFHFSEPTGQVFDPRVKANMDDYFRLTETYVNEYGKPELFHTIGLAEREIFPDRRSNHYMKLYTYRRIAQRIHTAYPNAKLLLATWDFMGDFWQNEDIAALLRELDPSRDIMLDYTGELDDDKRSFLSWGMVGKFPWIFGLFHAYEYQNDIRGPYDCSKRRLEIAAADPYCKGMVVWPELSHSDTLMLEYVARNSWKPEQLTIEPLAEDFAMKRYGEYGKQMNVAWQAYLPLVKQVGWCYQSRTKPEDPDYEKYCHSPLEYRISLTCISFYRCTKELTDGQLCRCKYSLEQVHPCLESIPVVIETLSTLPDEALENPFVQRDVMDIARSLLERIAHYGVMKLILMRHEYANGADNQAAMEAQMDAIFDLSKLIGKVLGCHEDLSMYQTLEGLKKVAPVNPVFEPTLKRNLLNHYCRQSAYEPWNYLYLDEQRVYFDWFRRNIAENNRGEWNWDVDDALKALYDAFMDKPLAEMQSPCAGDLRALIAQATEIIGRISI